MTAEALARMQERVQDTDAFKHLSDFKDIGVAFLELLNSSL